MKKTTGKTEFTSGSRAKTIGEKRKATGPQRRLAKHFDRMQEQMYRLPKELDWEAYQEEQRAKKANKPASNSMLRRWVVRAWKWFTIS